MRITVATPTFNRANTLHRVFDSLMHQSFKDFEWIVVDDGSKDSTRELVNSYKQTADFNIKYIYQENSGKHIALNKAVSEAQGDFFIIADSDDAFVEHSFQTLLKYWDLIEESRKSQFRGITCRCYDPVTMLPIGKAFPGNYMDMPGLEAVFKNNYNFEMWGMNRLDVMKEFPFPCTDKEDGNPLSFFPESIIWNRMGRKYKVRFINDHLRAYYRDQENSATSRKKSRSRENIYLWEHYLNDVFDYFFYNPKLFIKASVGMSMDGFLLKLKLNKILKRINKLVPRLLVLFFMPAGYFLYSKKKNL